MLAVCVGKSDDLGALETRVAALNLPQDDEGPTDRTRFIVTEQRWFEVTGDFPRIVPQSFVNAAVPAGVQGLGYRIDLDGVSQVAEREMILERLGADL